MKNILPQIVAHKKEEVKQRKQLTPVSILETSSLFASPVRSIKASLDSKNSQGIIAEFKRQSPSKGVINAKASVEETVAAYVNAGASAISVLTDEKFFGGSFHDFAAARAKIDAPMLRKDFIIDEYQVVETKSIGADVILLIAAILTPAETLSLARIAKQLGLEVLLEIHDASELDRINDFIDVVGVNNRNLDTFSVSLSTSLELAKAIPQRFIKISESGIDSPEQLLMLREHGYRGFLIGERFMKENDPGAAFETFIASVRHEMNFKTIDQL